MGTKKLLLIDEPDYHFDLFGLVFGGRSYVLASRMNKALGLSFLREADLELSISKADVEDSFPLYASLDEAMEMEYFLVANKSKTYLIPEQRVIDFFFMIKGEYRPLDSSVLLDQVRAIAGVTFAMPVDVSTLKSKQNLLF
jgi:hypothetical protein